MEPLGLAIGVVGLAGLFSTCIDCFSLVQHGRYLGRDRLILETKYTNQRLRLLTWGRACGFMDGGDSDDPAWSDNVHSAVSDTLVHIAALFQNHKTLSKRYGLSNAEPSARKSVASSVLSALVPRLRATNLVDLAPPVRSTAKRPTIPTAARWAIHDK